MADDAEDELTEAAREQLRADLEAELGKYQGFDETAAEHLSLREAIALWHRLEGLTSGISDQLSEQLRLVLEASLATRMSGDFRTGKRLNMRKIIPYIASQFRKDKIWLRRSKPSKREYQVSCF